MTEAITLKNFATELDRYIQRLDPRIDFYISKFNLDIPPNSEVIILDINSLKENINKYLTSPIILNRMSLDNKLTTVTNKLKKEFSIENSFISALIASINKLLFKIIIYYPKNLSHCLQ